MSPHPESNDNWEAKDSNWDHRVILFIFRAGIGDGGNDVGMIQCASIGLGIVGKEGNHAALASDVSMK